MTLVVVVAALVSSRFDQGIVWSGLGAIIPSSVGYFSLIVALNFVVATRFCWTSARPSNVITLLAIDVEAVSDTRVEIVITSITAMVLLQLPYWLL